ncbi:hypothetical protein RhiirA4_456095 [Rhizophagus irregularis]|uniref:Uncharacterized protein n=1 Tax=Rhizophagus irregularis TaxID=588596 RepID=A0A2I1G6S0_9GLOM|nr:hypothetical protein RhiirA4_456095 [Rhizophagus irregularis]
MSKNNKKLTLQTCTIPDRILNGSCIRCHNPLVAKYWCKSCQTKLPPKSLEQYNIFMIKKRDLLIVLALWQLWHLGISVTRFQGSKNWTSGNLEVDELIQNSQLETTDNLNYFELIDHKKIVNIEFMPKVTTASDICCKLPYDNTAVKELMKRRWDDNPKAFELRNIFQCGKAILFEP